MSPIPGQDTPAPVLVPQQLQPLDLQIPREVLNLIPEFSGETKTLSLFLRKCNYVITRYQGTRPRNEFLMQCITSKLTGKAAALISERGDFGTYEELEALLVQHFGDPRSEECVAIELETLKIKSNESYLEFCSRIQDIRAILLSKVNQNTSPTLREAKRIIYNNTSLNVFLYNLSEHMVRLVRMKNPYSLEEALKHVLEEVNFQEQYNMRTKMLQNKPVQISFRPPLPTPQSQFKFGIPNQANNLQRPNLPNFAYRAPMPTQYGFRPQFNNTAPAQQQIAQRPQFGFRPQPQVSQFGFRPQPGQFNYKAPPGQFGFRPQPGQFGYRPPQPQGYRPPHQYPNDVSMRTAPARPQQLPVNETYALEGQYDDYYYPYEPCDNYEEMTNNACDGMYTYHEPSVQQYNSAENNMYENHAHDGAPLASNDQENVNTTENFHISVLPTNMK